MMKVLAFLCVALLIGPNSVFSQNRLTLVEVISTPERTQTLKAIISEFEAANPEVQVDIISLRWGQAFGKLAAMVAAGSAPDVVEMPGRWLSLYAGNGMLMPLEDRFSGWDHSNTLTPKVLNVGRSTDGNMYTIPYGIYLRALFYNRQLLMEAGIEEPPATMSEFMEASRKVSELEGKYGYCMRGGSGGVNAWLMFAATMNGSNEFYTKEGKSRLDEPGSIKGIQFLIDMYQKGYAPRDSINWGFEEILQGFYSGTCAFLDQDPDALITISKHMSVDDFAVAPMPVGPAGTAFPTIGYAGWSVFKSTRHVEQAWDLVAHLSSPESNNTWAKRVGVIPIHQGTDLDPFFQTDQFKGWFVQLNEVQYQPTLLPIHLEGFGEFAETIALKSSHAALLGERSAADIAREWANFMSEAYASWMANRVQ